MDLSSLGIDFKLKEKKKKRFDLGSEHFLQMD
jgi:hypothetical protein